MNTLQLLPFTKAFTRACKPGALMPSSLVISTFGNSFSSTRPSSSWTFEPLLPSSCTLVKSSGLWLPVYMLPDILNLCSCKMEIISGSIRVVFEQTIPEHRKFDKLCCSNLFQKNGERGYAQAEEISVSYKIIARTLGYKNSAKRHGNSETSAKSAEIKITDKYHLQTADEQSKTANDYNWRKEKIQRNPEVTNWRDNYSKTTLPIAEGLQEYRKLRCAVHTNYFEISSGVATRKYWLLHQTQAIFSCEYVNRRI